uniref:Uncharacterized protein n=1 Tax=Anguilla anguilla TaxID=7936 RepID=A0A0E9UZV3_ANGAN
MLPNYKLNWYKFSLVPLSIKFLNSRSEIVCSALHCAMCC